MTDGTGQSRSKTRRRIQPRLRRALLGTLVVILSLSAGASWVGHQGWQARHHLTTAADLARELGRQLLDGDVTQARHTLAALQRQAREARAATTDPGWWLSTHLPYAGDNLAAVHGIAVAVDDLSRRVFPSILRLDLAAVLPRSGGFDVAALRSAEPTLTAADTAMREIRQRFDAVPSTALWSSVATAVRQLRGELDRLAVLTATARRAAVLLPPLLGADGARTYLLASQNPAELRATGGMLGAYAVIRADRGRVELVTQGAASELRYFDRPVLPLDPDMQTLYTDLLGVFPADVNLTPHFPTAAVLYREMYRRRTGVTVDGVLATDPVVLSYLLQAIGPVRVPGHATLVADTAVRTLLSDTYQKLGFKAQDDYFAASAMAVFDAMIKRPVDPRALLAALDRAITERRILFWSARPDEQRHLLDTRLAGVLPEQEKVPTVGVFLNDGSGAKLGYYLARDARLTVGNCRPDGRRELHLRLTLSSTVPRSGLSKSVLGLGMAGDPYTVRTLVYVFSPAGGLLHDARLDGVQALLGSGRERGRQVGVVSVDLRPGQTRVLEVGLFSAVTRTGAAELWLTPGATPWTTHISSAPSCSQ
ncbi:hypothetical protein GCM10027280_42290 [Micromonospora polyrhachis]|uniref:DUF4012 domain-containing protein n=1 Tax=Micromonospora polyrhachis TaxID=1282883 RepID=A0A7W7WSJ1_9ACTN|nr:DUF4012 domain-containing protein [Micromonospora polyrhachis]MBB4962044.1 hypothetical protein [Micromonospora polyrhachis]